MIQQPGSLKAILNNNKSYEGDDVRLSNAVVGLPPKTQRQVDMSVNPLMTKRGSNSLLGQ